MPKNKQSNLIASAKTPNIGFITKYVINSEIKERGGGYLVLINYQSFLSDLFPLTSPSPQLFSFIKNRRNRLLRVSFIE